MSSGAIRLRKSRINQPRLEVRFDAPAIIAAVNHENRERMEIFLDAGADINGALAGGRGSFGVLDSASIEYGAAKCFWNVPHGAEQNQESCDLANARVFVEIRKKLDRTKSVSYFSEVSL
jgi:hypothetical protein